MSDLCLTRMYIFQLVFKLAEKKGMIIASSNLPSKEKFSSY